MSAHYAIGIDVGGTSLRIGLVTEEGEIIRKVKRHTSGEVLKTIIEAAGEIHSSDVAGIGIGIAGLPDRRNIQVATAPNLHSIVGVDIVREIETQFAVPVFLENDANAAALGEKIAGAGRGFARFVLLTLGTGIGGGIIYEGRLLNIASEIGHMSIKADSEKCPCGNIGCLENYASARAMISRALSMLESGAESLLRDCCEGSFYKLTPEDIYTTALDGDGLSREILKEAGKYLGVGIANIINILSPEAIILTGGLLGAWNIYVQEAIKEASRRAFRDLFESVKIIPSSLGDEAGMIGAASLVFSRP